MAARSPLRFLAPIAIALFLAAVVYVVASSDNSKKDSSSQRTAAPAKVVPRRRTYVVRAGDTLTSISDKTGVSTATLIALNPRLDPQTLQLGDRLKLRP